MYAARHHDDQRLLIHIDDLARAFKISSLRIRQLMTEGAVPRSIGDGHIDFYQFTNAYIEYLRKDGQIEKQRMAKARAEMAELKVKQMKGEFIPSEAVARQWGELIGRHKQKLSALPTRVAPVLAAEKDPTVIQSLLQDMMEDILTELADSELEEKYEEQYLDDAPEHHLEREPDFAIDGYDDEDPEVDEEYLDSEGHSPEPSDDRRKGAKGRSSATKDEGERVGRQVSSAKQRSKR